jgi:hypothetical protein
MTRRSRAQPLNQPQCPLCGASNDCAAARNGTFETPCWCAGASIDAALLACVPAAQRGRACVCAACAARQAPGRPDAAGDPR